MELKEIKIREYRTIKYKKFNEVYMYSSHYFVLPTFCIYISHRKPIVETNLVVNYGNNDHTLIATCFFYRN